MPNLRVNFDEAPSFEPVPEDTYTLQITDAKPAKQTPAGEYRKLFGFTIADGELAGRMIWQGYMLEGKGAGFFRDLCEAAGVDPVEVAGASSDEEIDDLLRGQTFDAHVVKGEYNGKPNNEITKVFAVRA